MKIRLGVIFGGASVEHEISILSALQAIKQLDRTRYEVIPFYISKQHSIYSDDKLLEIKQYRDMNKLLESLEPVALYRKKNKVYYLQKQRLRYKEKEIDVFLPIMHGTNGEDGSIQGYLRTLQATICGCDILAAAIGQDKALMKTIFHAHDLPQVPYCVIDESDWKEDLWYEKCKAVASSWIVKPANLGSSIAIQKANTKETLYQAIETALHYDTVVVVEQCLENMREFNCSVLGNQEEMETSAIEEVCKQDEILSYQDKYGKEGKSKGMVSANRILPACITKEQEEEVQRLAKLCFHALRCEGVVRIDFMQDLESGKIYVNEINTMPGSLSFYLWQEKGLSFTQLLERLIQLAFAKARKRNQKIFAYDTNILQSWQGGAKGSKSIKGM